MDRTGDYARNGNLRVETAFFLQSFVLRHLSTVLKSEAREPLLALEFPRVSNPSRMSESNGPLY